MRFSPTPGITTHRSRGIDNIPTYGFSGWKVARIMVSVRPRKVSSGALSTPSSSTLVRGGTTTKAAPIIARQPHITSTIRQPALMKRENLLDLLGGREVDQRSTG